MIRGLDHIGVAVKDAERTANEWQEIAGAKIQHREEITDQHVKIVKLRIGSLEIELLEPLSADSPVGRFLAKRGEGVHHVAIQCDSVQDELNRLSSQGVSLVDKHARHGAEDSNVGFVHPRAISGVLLEFVDHAHPES